MIEAGTGRRAHGAPQRIAWFHCFAGIAGDMALGALLDAGADLDAVRRILEPLPLPGWSLSAEPAQRGGIAATRAVVEVRDDSVVRTHAHIVGLVEEARLPPRVRDRALATFAALAEAEGRVHRRPPPQVTFHEAGGHDAIVDVVATCAALEVLGVAEVATSPVATGTGMVRTAHGLLPNPTPAVVELLAGLPLAGRSLDVELTTPTGAALLAAMATRAGPLPPVTVEATGYGAGSRELDALPNVTQVVLGRSTGWDPEQDRGQPVVLLEANLDDTTGEVLAHTVAALLEAGAHDAWTVPVVMKKGRPGHVLAALADVSLAPSLAEVLSSETGTLGVRAHDLTRWPAPRSTGQVDVAGLPVRMKVGPDRVKPEYDDAVVVARRTGLPLREVIRRAEAAWEQGGGPSAPGRQPPPARGDA
ncbi:MAG TPA: nickel pincer cofactor biosynthesis protein LarC [Acidimicrobiales bacterium]|nr:nickel pincer cofactor biosynthesis protein LarC [Acidimicrobiales bacterium]